jgi:predicted nucleic-acid-binding Zn-ribbon protein
MSGNKNEPQPVEVMGRPFRCLACGNDRFYQGKAQLNTAWMTAFNLDWLNKSATYVSCSDCGHMSWFSQ